MSRFRRVMRSLLRDRVGILSGTSSPGAAQYRHFAIQVFAGHSKHSLARLVGLEAYCNGDWRVRGRVQHFVAVLPADQLGMQKLKCKVIDELVWLLVGAKPRIFPRHRWRGGAEAVGDIGLLEICHGLLSLVFPVWAETYGTTTTTAGVGLHSSGAAGSAAMPQLVDDLGGVAHDLADGEHAGVAGIDAPPGPQPPQSASDGAGADAGFHDDSTRIRHAAFMFLQVQHGGPLANMLALRLQLEPLRAHLHRQIVICSDKWEKQQRCQEARAIADGSPGSRKYRVLICALGVLEESYLRHLRFLFATPQLWALAPSACWTEEFNAIQFILLSRQGALTSQLLGLTHRCYPFRLFLLLQDLSVVEHLEKDPECLLDGFSRDFVLNNNLRLPETVQRLRLIAMMATFDIVRIECLHASIRRLIQLRSVQTHRLELSRLSSEWVSTQNRGRDGLDFVREHQDEGPAQGDAVPGDDGGGVAPPHRHHHGGGAWRAFVSETDVGEKRDFKNLGQRYRGLLESTSPDDVELLERLRDQGVHANRARRAGAEQPFGVRSRDVVKELRRREQQSVWEAVQDIEHDVDKNKAIAAYILEHVAAGTDPVTAARSQVPGIRNLCSVLGVPAHAIEML